MFSNRIIVIIVNGDEIKGHVYTVLYLDNTEFGPKCMKLPRLPQKSYGF